MPYRISRLTLGLVTVFLISAMDVGADSEKNIYFGELHLHTTFSLDGYSYGSKLDPDAAYRYAKGEPVRVPYEQLSYQQGLERPDGMVIRRSRPLDFMAVTDHSEGMGTLRPLLDQESALSRSDQGKKILADAGYVGRIRLAVRDELAEMMGLNTEELSFLRDKDAMIDAWEITKKAANDNYEPGVFTTLIAYEWSAFGQAEMAILLRNVYFVSDDAPQPFTAADTSNPEELWAYMGQARRDGYDSIAVPHNGNVSNGQMFSAQDVNGDPLDKSYAQARSENEPLYEISQTKGTSETMPDLSPLDEF
ncbi:MAG: DUF3604 domain-containing protein, partial [Betaproteobacteria bacterium]